MSELEADLIGDVRRHGGGSEVEYRVIDGDDDAKRLVVVLPSLRGSRARMADQLSADLLPGGAHQLLLGDDTYLYFGPNRRHCGVNLAVDLVRREADRRGIDLDHVLLVGSRFGGSLAMWIGMAAGVGGVVADRPAIRLGRMIGEHLDRAVAAAESEAPDASKSATTAAALRLIPGIEDEAVQKWLDRVLGRAAQDLDTTVEIDVFRPDGDITRFIRQLGDDPRVRVTVHGGADGPASFSELVLDRLR